MYKLTQCVKKHNVGELMNHRLTFLMRFSRGHVGVMNFVTDILNTWKARNKHGESCIKIFLTTVRLEDLWSL